MQDPTPALQEILNRIDRLQESVDALRGRGGPPKARPGWLPISEAARLAGFSIVALQSRLRRERERADGFQIRRRHGAVHKGDFMAYLDREAAKKSGGRGAQIRNAIRHLEREIA